MVKKVLIGEQAALAFYGEKIDLLPQPDFKTLFSVLKNGDVDASVVPIENALAGSVYENYDRLLQFKLPIVGEIILRVSHHLMVLPGVKREDIHRVISHPQALEQCRDYLESWQGIHVEPTYDTAGSAKKLLEENLHDTAAIASKQAADEYGLDVLANGIESNHQNFTRFLILEKTEKIPAKGGKTSIVFSFKDMPGALFKSFSRFCTT